jgi:hypothetical protein
MEDLTKTITYYYIKDDSIFETDKERDNFIKYCEYMMFSNYDEPHPIPEEDCKDYFRSLYKAIEMRYEEDILEAHYGKKIEEEEKKENDEMKYYEDNDNYFDSLNYYEDLYSQYYFGRGKK